MPDPTAQARPLAHRRDGLNVAEAAERAGVHPGTIRAWIKAGRLPVTRFGPPGRYARIRIHPQDVDDAAGPIDPPEGR